VLYKFHNFFGLGTEIDCILRNSKINKFVSLASITALSILFGYDYGTNVHCLFLQYYDLIYMICEGISIITFYFIGFTELERMFRYKKLPENIEKTE
jgi:hypothetical protein